MQYIYIYTRHRGKSEMAEIENLYYIVVAVFFFGFFFI